MNELVSAGGFNPPSLTSSSGSFNMGADGTTLVDSTGTNLSGGVPPEAVSFDGVTDYLSKSSISYSNEVLITFSCWMYNPSNNNPYMFECYGVEGTNNTNFVVYFNGNNLYFTAYLGATITLSVSYTIGSEYGASQLDAVNNNTFNHVYFTVDMTNSSTASNTDVCYFNSKRIYKTGNMVVNYQGIRFPSFTDIKVMRGKGRMSHLYLKNEYYTSPLRHITADGKPTDPATLQALNPILYLPMEDKETAHINLGTGGDFVQNGLLETADRGPNQDNCVMSEFDGVDDFLGNSIQLPDTTLDSFTFSCTCKNVQGSTSPILYIGATDNTPSFTIQQYWNGDVNMLSVDVNGNVKTNQTFKHRGLNQNIHISMSFNSDGTGKCYVDGIDITGTVVFTSTYFSTEALIANIGKGYNNTWEKGSIGELYFDTTYIDLSTNNPFWDSDTNKPIPVRKAMETLGSNPLICMPIDASNPTKNYGSGGDFTLYGGGLLGARGMSEYISRSILVPSSLDYLTLGASNFTSTFSMVISVLTSSIDDEIFQLTNPNYTAPIRVVENSYGRFDVYVYGDASQSPIAIMQSVGLGTTNEWKTLFVSVDVSNGIALAFCQEVTVVGSTVDNEPINMNGEIVIGKGIVESLVSSTYFTTDYIDFSQEANRNLFVNQLGYPRDLKPLIDNGTIPNPLVYLPFDDPNNLGKNLGTAGDFTVNGTVTPGADFSL